MIEKRSFGKTKDGQEAFLYILRNRKGMEAHILDYGAALVRLYVPDKKGQIDDIVLGFDDITGYEVNESSQGVVVGRVANRIGGGTFTLNGRTYMLDQNQGENTLHSGFDRYGFHFYKAYPEEESSVTLKRISPHMEQGFPGNLNLAVTYQLTEENELILSYEARSDRDTPLNLTNHSYFNLGGYQTQDLSTHQILIRSSVITATDENSLCNGSLLSIANSPMDLRRMTPIMERIDMDYKPLKIGAGFDHNYILEHKEGEPDAIAEETVSGRRMEVYTDLPGMQFYTANWLSESEIGKGGIPHKPRTAVCFETQFFPNSCNIPSFPDTILKEGEKFKSTTKYCFRIIK
ncbi:MAG: aldose epimerase family protein [Lachnospiraceae bacterium]|nr:aldose epimerase family protein [Lachnospiraceae bacterium]